ncbi:hypothetical protein B0H14DRAFT_3446275 [Mycena olivaceomarginata]|nr:hypothetical protein B0H14DRAFT_3446275 [Mycena olivaceomarginata]
MSLHDVKELVLSEPELRKDVALGEEDPADNTCRRCRAGGHVCIVERRKPRTAPK